VGGEKNCSRNWSKTSALCLARGRADKAGWRSNWPPPRIRRGCYFIIRPCSRRIDLTQLYYLAVALRVHPIHFLPKMDWSKPVKAQIDSQ
jgi:hypothetical protein